jgi:ATP-dependent helicase/nuclease subunit A
MATAPISTGEQRAAADPGVSAWVMASAGTGKTHVLTDRVLRLLLDGAAPERILCLTFTKAAAAEMFNRLQERLGKWAIADDAALAQELHGLTGQPLGSHDLAAARRLFTGVLETPGGLKIQTIHAFCEALLRRFPAEAGVPPHFDVLDERGAEELMELARDRLYAEDVARPAPLLSAITPLVDQDAFADLMRGLVGERVRLRSFLGRHGSDPEAALQDIPALLGLAPDEDEAAVIAAACAEETFDGDGLRRAVVSLETGSKTDQARAQAIAGWLADPAARADGMDEYFAAFLKKTDAQPLARLATKKVAEADPDVPDILLCEAERLAMVQARIRACRLAALTVAAVRLAGRLLALYEAEKQRQARLDYDDLILHVRDLVSTRAAAQWVLYKLDGGLDHVLIDEAQDTNPEQWDIAVRLCEEFFAGEGARLRARTVFAVGDVKQSIYGFQRADPSVFVANGEHFAARAGAAGGRFLDVDLELSYRSTETVLDVVNAVFARDEARSGLTYDTRGIQHKAFRAGQAGLVELWPPEAPDAAENEETEDGGPDPNLQEVEEAPARRLAARIAERIAAWLADGERLESEDRPVRPGDILILVQKRAPFTEVMVRELKQRRIPVAGVDRMVLTDQLAVMDLVALGQFLVQTDDDLTLANVLKSPLCGFGDADLFALAHGRAGRLWPELQRRHGENGVFAAAHGMLADLLRRVDFVRPYELYAELLGAGGGRRRMLARLGPDADDPIDEFLALALQFERDHPPGMQGFLHWLTAAETEVKRDQEQRRDEVRVMTVHGAKGLQAPVVFLADTCRIAPLRDKLYWRADGAGMVPLWRPSASDEEPVSRAAVEAAKAAAEAESHRLLYVALTRAADRLYVGGFEKKRKGKSSNGRDEGCWYDLIHDAMASMPGIEKAADGILRRRNPQTVEPSRRGASAPELMPAPAPAWLGRPAPAEPSPPMPLAPSRPDEDPPARSPLSGIDEGFFQRGRLVHRLLEILPDLPPGQRAAAAARFLARPAHGLDAAPQAALAGEVMAILENPGFAPLFAEGSVAEAAISGMIGDHAVSGRIDRLAVTDSSVLVVDYKTNRPPPAHPDAVAPGYLRQLAIYRALLEKIYPDKTISCALLWTVGPNLMEVPPAQLIAALA